MNARSDDILERVVRLECQNARLRRILVTTSVVAALLIVCSAQSKKVEILNPTKPETLAHIVPLQNVAASIASREFNVLNSNNTVAARIGSTSDGHGYCSLFDKKQNETIRFVAGVDPTVAVVRNGRLAASLSIDSVGHGLVQSYSAKGVRNVVLGGDQGGGNDGFVFYLKNGQFQSVD
ncbi:MAG: hypothetical protein H8E66_33380 [Planctomycetes bacterium]|nr:hypothetical protein [Planctomycetota bacterium]